jgi:hypothetical protein
MPVMTLHHPLVAVSARRRSAPTPGTVRPPCELPRGVGGREPVTVKVNGSSEVAVEREEGEDDRVINSTESIQIYFPQAYLRLSKITRVWLPQKLEM